tara:strand:- start:44 stop:217 length:174 start_codon:yes stop_codon:yes gene_type:complete
MDVEAKVVMDRIKRCVSTAKARAKKRNYSGFHQQMQEIEALFDILDSKITFEKEGEK